MLRRHNSITPVQTVASPTKKLMPDTFLKPSKKGQLSSNSVHQTTSQMPTIAEFKDENRFDLQVSSAEHIQFLRLDGEKLKRAISTMPLETVRSIVAAYHEFSRAELGLKTKLEQENQTTLTGDVVPSVAYTHEYESKPCTSLYGW